MLEGREEGLNAGVLQGRQERTEEIMQAIRSMPIEEVFRTYQKQ